MLNHTQIDLFLVVETGINPVAMVHVHRLDEVRLDDLVVHLSSLNDNLHALLGVLTDDCLRCWVYNVTLHLVKILRRLVPVLAPFTVVKVLLKAERPCVTLNRFLRLALAAWLEPLADGAFLKLGTAHDEDDFVVGGVILEAT